MNSKIVNIMGFLLGLIVFGILISSLIKSVRRIRIGNEIIEKTKIKVEKAEKEKIRLEEQLKVVQSESYLEKQLRDKLGLTKEGEIVLVLPEAEIVKKLSPQIPEEIDEKPKPNWQKWMELFK